MRNRRLPHRPVVKAATSYAVLPVTTGLLADWDASAGVTLGTGVSSWVDRTGTYTLSQATGGAQPSVSTLNGRTALSFDGVDDVLSGAAGLAAAIDESAPYTVYVVAKLNNNANFYTMFACSNNSNNYLYHLARNVDGFDLANRGDPTATSSIGASSLGTTAYDYCAAYTGSAYSTWINGSASVVASANTRAPVCTVTSIGGLMLGSAIQLFPGLIGRVLVYNGSHTTERATISAFLRAQFGL